MLRIEQDDTEANLLFYTALHLGCSLIQLVRTFKYFISENRIFYFTITKFERKNSSRNEKNKTSKQDPRRRKNFNNFTNSPLATVSAKRIEVPLTIIS